MAAARTSRRKQSHGQSLVETVLIVPLLVLITLNVVNLAYFFLVAIHLSGASRTAAIYSIQGSATPAASQLPDPGGSTPTTNVLTVTYLAFQDMTGSLWNPTGASVQVCSPINIVSGSGVNGTGASQAANCETCTSSGCGTAGTGSPAPDADPEAPNFVLNQVRISYTFNTLIPGTLFNLPLQASPMCNSGSCTFVRMAEMRAMN
jgi:Flp pilus assembly protein TadG